MADELNVVALVDAGWDSPGVVLNRPLSYVYDWSGNDLIGYDGPFRDVLKYAPPSRGNKAFAGREFDIPLSDGSTVRASGQYWSGHLAGYISVGVQTVEGLQKCYVFYGTNSIKPDDLDLLLSAYSGPVYPYWDYEKVIKYDSERLYWINRFFAEERAKNHVIRNAKAAHRRLEALAAPMTPSGSEPVNSGVR